LVTWFNLSVLYIDEIALEFEKKTVSTHFAHIIMCIVVQS